MERHELKLKLASVAKGPTGTYRIEGLELFKAGTWYPQSGGEINITSGDLDDMVSTFKAIGTTELQPGLKLGHVDSIEGGLEAPRFGSLVDVWRDGDTVYGTLEAVPQGLAVPIQNGAWPRVSLEVWRKFTASTGETYAWAISDVAFLGSTLPAVTTLADVAGLYGMPEQDELPVAAASEARGDELVVFSAERPLVRFGILTDRIRADNKAAAMDEITWRASDLAYQVIRGEGEYGELDIPARVQAMDEIMQDVQALWESPEQLDQFSVNLVQNAPEKSTATSREGTEQEETEMAKEEKATEDLSRLESERDELAAKLEAAEKRATEQEAKLTEQEQKARMQAAEVDAKSFCDGCKGMTPAEREIVEPMMVVLMAAPADDAPIEFSHGEEEISVVDGMKRLFELRKDLPAEMFEARLKKADPNAEPESAEERVRKLASAKVEEESISYTDALAKVKREEPELYAEMDRERRENTKTLAPSQA